MLGHIIRLLLAAFTLVVDPNLVSAQEGAPATTLISAQDLRADFSELYEKLKVSHYDLYVRRPKPEYDALYEAMSAGFTEPLSLQDAHVRFQKFLAYGRVAHSRTDGFNAAYATYREKGGKTLPLTLRVVQGRVHVIGDLGGPSRITLGDELLELNGRPLPVWLGRLGVYVSADNDYMLHTLLEFDFTSLFWLDTGPQASYAAKLRSPDGVAFDIDVPARSRDEMRDAAAAGSTLDLDWNQREWRMVPDGIAYLRPGPFYNPDSENMWDTASFVDFIDGAFQGMIEADARALVIDLRNNAGGDNAFSDRMVSWFADEPYRFVSEFRVRVSQAAIDTNQKRLELSPDDTSRRLAAAYRGRKPGDVVDFDVPFACPRTGQRFDGSIFLLINRHSYSNTVMVAALAQDYGFATIVGEETSDLATTYGAMEQFALTRTGITIGFPKAYIVRPSGATDARGVIPDVAIATPIVESTEDPVLQRALAMAAEAAARSSGRRTQSLSPKIAEALARQAPCRE